MGVERHDKEKRRAMIFARRARQMRASGYGHSPVFFISIGYIRMESVYHVKNFGA